MGCNKIPVTVISGYLGSGKTTLLNNLLNAKKEETIFVLMNEFGEVDIDGKMLIRSEEQLIEFNNGCLCCTVRQDLIKILTNLGTKNNYQRIFIETTGLADPAPIASTFFVIPEIREKFELDAFITVVDSFNIEESLEDSHETMEQVTFADIIIMNKIDTIDIKQKRELKDRIQGMNPIATIYEAKECNVNIENLLDVHAFNLDAKLKVDSTFLEDLPHDHDDSIKTFVLRSENPIDENAFQAYISNILNQKKMQILRCKGFIYSAFTNNKIIFQTVRMLSALTTSEEWEENENPCTELVFIGRNLNKEELERILRRCVRKKRLNYKADKNIKY